MFNRLENESGYSLVEVMVAIMILATAIIPMVSMFDASLRAAVLGGNYDKARAIANEELEEIRALPLSGTPNSVVAVYPPGDPRPCTGTIEAGYSCRVQTTYVRLDSSSVVEDPSARAMMQVKVTVTWDGGSKSYLATGLISKETRCASGC